jgi:hypothetical protein
LSTTVVELIPPKFLERKPGVFEYLQESPFRQISSVHRDDDTSFGRGVDKYEMGAVLAIPEPAPALQETD